MANDQYGIQDGQINLAQLMQLPGAVNALPPTSPVQPQAPTQVPTAGSPGTPGWPGGGASDSDSALKGQALAQAQYGQSQVAEEIKRIRNMGDEEASLRAQQAGLQTRYHPNFEPVTGGKTFLRDLGRGALSFLAATGPGQALEDVIYSQPRHEYANLAEQIKDIQNQIEGEKEIVPAAAGLAYHPMMAAAHQESADASWLRAQSYTKYVNDLGGFHNFLEGLDTSKLTEEQRHHRVEEQLGMLGIGVQRDRNQVFLSLGDKRIGVQESEFNAAVANKNQGWFSQILQGLGVQHFFGAENTGVGTGVQPLSPGTQPFATPPQSSATPGAKANPVDSLVNKYGRKR